MVRKGIKIIRILFFIAVMGACQKTHPNLSSRTYRMGFQNSAPRLDINLDIQALNVWVPNADAAIINVQPPWDSLVKGEDPITYVVGNFQGLVSFYRSKNVKIWVYIDPENGLNRSSDADELVAIGKSIANADIQLLYRRFAKVMDSVIRPDHFGFALETNLIRGIAPDSIYQGVRQAANAGAQDIRKFDAHPVLSISIQVDYAWGLLSAGVYQGISKDLMDFPFIQELGLSSYPYFVFKQPSDIPLNYFSKLVEGKTLPVFSSEGGWTSQSIPSFTGQNIASNPQMQADYITRQSQLLDQAKAIAWFQLTFTDIDLNSLPPGVSASIKYFAYLGMVDIALQPRPSWSAWSSIFHKTLTPGN